MHLRKLTVAFKNVDDFFSDINKALENEKDLLDEKSTLVFDSPETYRSFMTFNKMTVLTAISRLKPDSIYKLAKSLNRKPQHVTADCHSLESHGFIKLSQDESGRKPIRPELIFDYDVVSVDDENINSIPVSELSEKVLNKAMAAG